MLLDSSKAPKVICYREFDANQSLNNRSFYKVNTQGQRFRITPETNVMTVDEMKSLSDDPYYTQENVEARTERFEK